MQAANCSANTRNSRSLGVESKKSAHSASCSQRREEQKDASSTLLQDCLRIWDRQSKKRDKVYTLRIFNFHSKTTPIKQPGPWSPADPKLQRSSCPPTINLFYQEDQLTSLLGMKHSLQTNPPKNVFRVKLSSHHSKARSPSNKSPSEDNVNEFNVNFKTIGSVEHKTKRQIEFFQRRKAWINRFYKDRAEKRQLKSIQVEPEATQNDFMISPW